MMTMNRKLLTGFCSLLLAAPLLAQTPPADGAKPDAQQAEKTRENGQQGNRRGEMRDRLMAADANKDDQWSREEWLAVGRRERGFEMMDADGNGQISREELRIGMERMQSMRGQRRED